jgi:hypothetical protein
MTDRIIGPSGSKRRQLWRYRFFILPVVAITAAAFIITSASAVHEEDLFELDKNVLDDTNVLGDDWSNIDAGTDSAFRDTGIHADPSPNSIFTGGGSKDYLGINNDPPADAWSDGPWKYKNGNVPDKDDITNAYAAAYRKDEGGVSHTFIYFGMDRFATEGSANVGFWFFKGNVAPVSGSNTFSGEHQDGDVLVLSEFDEGGTGVTIKVFEWVGTGGDEGGGTLQTLFGGEEGAPADCADPAVPDTDDVCATVNNETIPDADIPWNYVGKGGTHDMGPGVFFEGGIDLTGLTGGGCVSNFLAETRSSFEVNAVLKDFVHSSFPLCEVSTTQRWLPNDTANVAPAGTTGTVTFKLYEKSGTCTDDPTDPNDVRTFTDSSAPYETTNTTEYTTSKTISWRASFQQTEGGQNVGDPVIGACEASSLTIDNDIATPPNPIP